MIHLRAALLWAWCGAMVVVLGCSHDYSSLNNGSGGSAGGQAAGHPGSGGAGATAVGGQLGSGGVAGTVGPGVAGAVGAGGAAGAVGAGGAAGAVGAGGAGGAVGAGGVVGAGGTIGPGGQTGTGGAGAAGQTGHGGAVGSGGTTGTGGSGTCQTTTLTFASPASSVLIFTDRGGSSFDTPATVGGVPTTGSFFNVRAAVEDAIAGLQGQYRFGLGVYVGDHSGLNCQLNYATVPLALNNAAAIATAYDALGPMTTKMDTPATAALAMAKTALLADTGAGSKFLLFITNGATDYCDDGLADCPTDSVTAQLQGMYAGSPGIETLVVGLSTTSTGLTPGALTTFANAGAGQPAALSAGTAASQSDIYYECNSITPWHNLFATSGKTGPATLGAYSATGGTAPLYKAATNATADIETQVKAALAAMKSCTFQLTAHAIDPGKVAEGSVAVGGASVAQDASNGWSMPSSTVVTLNGAACSSYRQTGVISISFPCDAIVP